MKQKVKDDPINAKNSNNKIDSIPSRLPESRNSEGNHLEKAFQSEEDVANGRDDCQAQQERLPVLFFTNIPRDHQGEAVEDYQRSEQLFEPSRSRQIVQVTPQLGTFRRFRRDVKRLGHFQTGFQIMPSSLIHCQQGRSTVLSVIRDDDSDEQG